MVDSVLEVKQIKQLSADGGATVVDVQNQTIAVDSITDAAGTGLPIGMIQGFDQYKLSAEVTSDGTITPWSQLTSVPHGVKGSIGSFTSGVYTFAETGYYFVSCFFTAYATQSDTIIIYIKDDNTGSTPEYMCRLQGTIDAIGYTNLSGSVIFNCNDTSVNKLFFEAASLNSGSKISTALSGYSKINIMKIG